MVIETSTTPPCHTVPSDTCLLAPPPPLAVPPPSPLIAASRRALAISPVAASAGAKQERAASKRGVAVGCSDEACTGGGLGDSAYRPMKSKEQQEPHASIFVAAKHESTSTAHQSSITLTSR